MWDAWWVRDRSHARHTPLRGARLLSERSAVILPWHYHGLFIITRKSLHKTSLLNHAMPQRSQAFAYLLKLSAFGLPDNIASQTILTFAAVWNYYEFFPKRLIQTGKSIIFQRFPVTQMQTALETATREWVHNFAFESRHMLRLTSDGEVFEDSWTTLVLSADSRLFAFSPVADDACHITVTWLQVTQDKAPWSAKRNALSPGKQHSWCAHGLDRYSGLHAKHIYKMHQNI